MLSDSIIKRYATGLLDAVRQTPNPHDIFNELKAVSSLLNKVDLLNDFLECPKISMEEKFTTFNLLLEQVKIKSLSPLTGNLLRLLLQNHRLTLLEAIVNEFEVLLFEKQGKVKAVITTVIDVKESEKKQLLSFLEAKLKKKVEAEFEKDQTILGGMKIRVEDQVWDGSVRKLLHNMETALMESESK